MTTSRTRRLGSDPSDQEVVHDEEPSPDDIPSGGTRATLEPSPATRKRRQTCLAASGDISVRTTERDKASTGSSDHAGKKDDGGNAEGAASPLVW